MDKISDDQIIGGLKETAATINRLMLSLLALGLFSLLAVGQPDAYLLNPAATVTVPSVGAVSATAMLVVTPIILIGIRVYLQIYVKHWYALSKVANERSLQYAPTVSPMRHPVLSKLNNLVLYFLVPLVLVLFTWKAMAIPMWLGLGLLTVSGFVTAAHFVQCWNQEWKIKSVVAAAVALLVGLVGFCVKDQLRRPFVLTYADLSDTILRDVDLRGADLRKANLANSDLRDADLRGANLRETRLSGADLTRADLRDVDAYLTDFSGAQLFRSKLHYANLIRVNFREAVLVEAILSHANLGESNLQDALLDAATLTETNMSQSNLVGAKFSGANLRETSLVMADISDVEFGGTVNLTQEQISLACLSGNHPKMLPTKDMESPKTRCLPTSKVQLK